MPRRLNHFSESNLGVKKTKFEPRMSGPRKAIHGGSFEFGIAELRARGKRGKEIPSPLGILGNRAVEPKHNMAE